MLPVTIWLLLAWAAPAAPPVRLPLAMTVNRGSERAIIAHQVDGQLWVPEKDLQAAGLRWTQADAHEVDAERVVALESIRPAIEYRIDEENAALAITADAASLPLQRIDLDGRPRTDVTPAAVSGFVNYASTVGVANAPQYHTEFGTTLHGAVLDGSLGWSSGALSRGPLTLTRDQPRHLLRVQAGEAWLPSFGSAAGQRLLGVTISRQLEMDPGLHRQSPLSIRGETSAPADAEIYVNGQLVDRRRLDAGPFELDNLNPAVGAGTAQVIVRDDYGRVQTLGTDYYRAVHVLRRGLQEFAYGAGAPVAANSIGPDYAGLSFTAQHRVGVTDAWTLGGRASRVRQLNEGSIESAFQLPIAEASLEVIGRQAGRVSGEQLFASLDSRHAAFSIGGSVRMATPGFINAPHSVGAASFAIAPVRELRAYLGAVVNGTSVTGAYTSSRDVNGLRLDQISGSLNRVYARRFNATLAIARGWQGSAVGWSLSTGVSVPLGSRASASVNYDPDSGVQVGARQSLPAGPGFGYQAQLGTANHAGALSAQWQGTAGTVTLETDPFHGSQTGRVTLAGSLAMIDGRVQAGRPITDAYALVDLSTPARVPVFLNNQFIGRTDSHGQLLVPALTSYAASNLRIDQASAPLSLWTGDDVRTVAPAWHSGNVVRFGARLLNPLSGRVIVRDGQRTIVPAYGEATLVGSDQRSPLGEHGEFFFDDLPAGQPQVIVLYLGARYTCGIPTTKIAPAAGLPRDTGTLACTPLLFAGGGE